MKPVFLSAGVPDQPERGPYVETSDPIAIRDAVRALTRVVLSRSKGSSGNTPLLVFGGHPAITPLVWYVADGLGRADAVVIYQSMLYEAVIPKEARYFGNLRFTRAAGTVAESQLVMRQEMFSRHQFGAGVFIGGMDGVEKEFALFKELHPNARLIPVPATGGAALRLASVMGVGGDLVEIHGAPTDFSFQAHFRRVLK